MIGFDLQPLFPELFLAISAMVLLVGGVFAGEKSTNAVFWLSAVCYVVAFVIMVVFSWQDAIVLNGMFKFDNFAGIMKTMILLGLLLSTFLAPKYLEEEGIGRFEYPVLMMMAGIGMMLMVSAYNLLAVYMALELQSLSLYVLAAFRRNSLLSSEAGVKYFSLGAISSGMILFGISLIYGFTGTLDYGALSAVFMQSSGFAPLGVTFGLVFLLAGIAFKISAVPFHMWTPDVYQGAPTSVTAFFAIVPKVAAFGLLMRLLYEPFGLASDQWVQIIWFLAVASMIVGSFAAIMQNNIKRLMAYSSIGNMGYALIGIATATKLGASATVLFLFIYIFMTAGAFAIIMTMRRDGKALENINDLAGLSRTRPALAYVLAILMFSMSGIPPMAGFFGKLVIFQAAVDKGLYVLAILGVVTSVVAAYYYLRIIKVMFFDEPAPAFDKVISYRRNAVIFASVIFVLCFILKPNFIMAAAQVAVSSLFVMG